MLQRARFLLGLVIFVLAARGHGADSPQQTASTWLDANRDRVAQISDAVWDYAELAFQEHKSSKLLADTLEQAGFKVRRGVADMKTAFVAEYGSGKPVIAFLAEYDALPGLSQNAEPVKEPRAKGKPGHGCGHNLLGTASVAAGLAVKEVLHRHKLPGKVIVFGTPAEEGGAGKVYMVRAGLFKDVDAVLSWHPSGGNALACGSCLAVKRARFRFHGLAAHAAASPHKGRSALDAVELMNVGANYLREHVPDQTRIHYVITKGGGRPNIVPEEAESWYYVRAPHMADAQEVFERIKEIAQGACLMTRTTVELLGESGTYETLPNMALSRVVERHFKRIGPPPFDAADLRFASELQRNYGLGQRPLDTALDRGRIDFEFARTMGSTDVGDVSWHVPTAELMVAARPVGTAAHSWAFTASAGSPIGHKSCVTAARVLAASALDLLAAPEQLQAAREEFRAKTREFKYQCGIPANLKPPEAIDDGGGD
jgi:aminobenzoyl-glutamate utilization protein B